MDRIFSGFGFQGLLTVWLGKSGLHQHDSSRHCHFRSSVTSWVILINCISQGLIIFFIRLGGTLDQGLFYPSTFFIFSQCLCGCKLDWLSGTINWTIGSCMFFSTSLISCKCKKTNNCIKIIYWSWVPIYVFCKQQGDLASTTSSGNWCLSHWSYSTLCKQHKCYTDFNRSSSSQVD